MVQSSLLCNKHILKHSNSVFNYYTTIYTHTHTHTHTHTALYMVEKTKLVSTIINIHLHTFHVLVNVLSILPSLILSVTLQRGPIIIIL